MYRLQWSWDLKMYHSPLHFEASSRYHQSHPKEIDTIEIGVHMKYSILRGSKFIIGGLNLSLGTKKYGYLLS